MYIELGKYMDYIASQLLRRLQSGISILVPKTLKYLVRL